MENNKSLIKLVLGFIIFFFIVNPARNEAVPLFLNMLENPKGKTTHNRNGTFFILLL